MPSSSAAQKSIPFEPSRERRNAISLVWIEPFGAESSTPIQNAAYAIECRIIAKELLGSTTNYSVRDQYDNVYIVSTEDESYTMAQNVWVGCQQQNLYLFDGKEQRIREGASNYQALVDAVRRL